MSAAKKKKGNSSTSVAWTVVAVIAVLAIVVVVALFILGRGGWPTPATSPTATETVPVSPTQTAAPTVSPTPQTLEQVQTHAAELVTARDAAGLTTYMAATVEYLAFGSEAPVQNLTPDAASAQISKVLGKETWTMTNVDTISQWKASPFGQYFPNGSLQMSSNKDHFLSFVFDETNRITQVIYGTAASLD